MNANAPVEVRPIFSSPRARIVRAATAHRRIRVAMVADSASLLPLLWWSGILFPGNAVLPIVLLAGTFLVWLGLGVALLMFRCPICKRPFHRGDLLDLFTKSCVNCGLSLALRQDGGVEGAKTFGSRS